MKKILSCLLILFVLVICSSCNLQITINDSSTSSPTAEVSLSSEAEAFEDSNAVYLLVEYTLTTYGNSPSISTIKNSYNTDNLLESTVGYYNGSESYRQEFLSYDSNCNPTKYILLSPEATQAEYYTDYTYDEQAQILTSDTFICASNGESYLYTSSEYSYNEAGQILTHIYRIAPFNDMLYTYIYSYSYDNNGFPIRSASYDQYSDRETVSIPYCDEIGNEVVILSLNSSDVIYQNYDSAGNILSRKTYRLGELLSSATYSYQIIGDPAHITPPENKDDVCIQTIIDTYFSALADNDTATLCTLLPAAIHKAAEDYGQDIRGYFDNLDYLAHNFSGEEILSIEAKDIAYNSAALLPTELQTEIMDAFSLTPEKTAVAIVDIEFAKENLTCAMILYRCEGNWYYLTSTLCQYAEK